MIIDDKAIERLREAVKPYLKEKRYLHTLGVERECARLGEVYLPECVNELRAAGLLHDITKRDDKEKQLQYCAEFGIIICKSDLLSPKLFHSKTASELLKRDFSDYADDRIVSAVRWHTTGRADMTLFDTIVYLADYIEDGRTFPDCVELRRYFWDGIEKGEDKMLHLYRTMVKSFDMTIRILVDEGAPIDRDTVEARNRFITELSGV